MYAALSLFFSILMHDYKFDKYKYECKKDM